MAGWCTVPRARQSLVPGKQRFQPLFKNNRPHELELIEISEIGIISVSGLLSRGVFLPPRQLLQKRSIWSNRGAAPFHALICFLQKENAERPPQRQHRYSAVASKRAPKHCSWFATSTKSRTKSEKCDAWHVSTYLKSQTQMMHRIRNDNCCTATDPQFRKYQDSSLLVVVRVCKKLPSALWISWRRHSFDFHCYSSMETLAYEIARDLEIRVHIWFQGIFQRNVQEVTAVCLITERTVALERPWREKLPTDTQQQNMAYKSAHKTFSCSQQLMYPFSLRSLRTCGEDPWCQLPKNKQPGIISTG